MTNKTKATLKTLAKVVGCITLVIVCIFIGSIFLCLFFASPFILSKTGLTTTNFVKDNYSNIIIIEGLIISFIVVIVYITRIIFESELNELENKK